MDCRIALAVLLAATLSTQLAAQDASPIAPGGRLRGAFRPGEHWERVQPIY